MEQRNVYDLFDHNQPTGWCGTVSGGYGTANTAFTTVNSGVLTSTQCQVNALLCPSRHQKGARNSGNMCPTDYAVLVYYLNPTNLTDCGGDVRLHQSPQYHRAALQSAIRDTSADWKPSNFTLRGGFASVTDGTSNTAMIAEKHIDRSGVNRAGGNTSSDRDGTPFYSGCGGFGPGYGENNIAGPTRNRPMAKSSSEIATNLTGTCNDPATAVNPPMVGSWHPGVVNFLMVDGSTRPISVTIDQTTLERLTMRDDGQAVQVP